MTTGCIILTTRQAATVHTSAVVNCAGAINMARLFTEFPGLQRAFYDEAADWQSIGCQIESIFPDLKPHDWGQYFPDDPTDVQPERKV